MKRALGLIAMVVCTSIARAQNPAEVVDWSSGVAYSYDGAGSVQQIGKDWFRYDHAGRLLQSSVNGIRRDYEYDAYGNRTKCIQGAGTAEESDCQGFTMRSSDNRIVEAAYDPSESGNVTGLSGHAYAYDEFNMMTRDQSAGAREFIYTADDERIAVYATASNSWHWTMRDDENKPVREYTSQGGAHGTGTFAWTKDYIWRDERLLASIQPQGVAKTTFHYHLDHQGSPRRVTDSSDNVAGFHDFHPFGPEALGKDESGARLKYTGHERDSALGVFSTLDYMHARYYSPVLGRFFSVDPAWESADLATPQTWNRYAYVMNNPLTYIDPTGRVFQCVTVEIGPGQSQQICSEVVDVNAKAPVVEPVEDNGFDWLKRELENITYLELDDFSFRHAPKEDLGQCIENNSFSNAYTAIGAAGNAGLNRLVGDTARMGIGGIPVHPTTWQNKAGRAVARRLYRSGSPGAAHAVHRAGRAAGRAAVVLTVFEGFYDIGTIGRCGALAAMR